MRWNRVALLAVGWLLVGSTSQLAQGQFAYADTPEEVLKRAAGVIGKCSADQALVELGKGTQPRAFEGIVREKCGVQERYFRLVFTEGLRKEGALDIAKEAYIDDMIVEMRRDAIVRYWNMLKKLHPQPDDRLICLLEEYECAVNRR
jgi:hypothetical protein